MRARDRGETVTSPQFAGHSSHDAATEEAPVSVVTQRLHAFMERRQDSRDQAAQQALRTLPRQQQTAIGQAELSLPRHRRCTIEPTDIAENKKRSLEHINAAFEDLFDRKRRRHGGSRRTRILSSHVIAPTSPERLNSQPEEQEAERCSPVMDQPAALEEPETRTAGERKEEVIVDGTRFEKSIKGLFSNLRRPDSNAAASPSSISALRLSPSGSPQPSAAVATPPRAYTPVALPLPPAALARSSENMDSEVQRLEHELLEARGVLEKGLRSTWSATTSPRTH